MAAGEHPRTGKHPAIIGEANRSPCAKAGSAGVQTANQGPKTSEARVALDAMHRSALRNINWSMTLLDNGVLHIFYEF